MLLTGCGEKDNSKKIIVGANSFISYTTEEGIKGVITANEVDKYIKIVTFKQEDVIFTRLVGIEDSVNDPIRGMYLKTIKYCDLDSGVTLIWCDNYDTSGKTEENIKYNVGENLEIVEVKDFMPYLYQEGKFADEYEINDLVSFYHEKVEPTLEETDEIILS